MCGVAAKVSRDGGLAEWANAMLVGLEHRGPDDDGYHVESEVVLVHTRLAIQDLDQRAACPMHRGAITLVYNGELWNGAAVRDRLRAAGHEFLTTGDTEVVATALAEWGPDALPRLEGMFALLWWDEKERRLYAARDRFGEVPLHMTRSGGEVAFSSELKAFDDPSDWEWVEPGSLVTVERGLFGWTARRSRWYEAPAAPVRMTLPEAGETMRLLMERAVKERAISDVPVCTLLSGGIDSTAVAYHLREHVPNLTAFTAVYDPNSQDVRMARLAADRLGIELVEVNVPLPTRDDLAEVVRRIEMPYKAQVEIGWPCLHLAREMRERGFKVAFSGEGSDELWASYGFNYHVLARTFEGRQVFGDPSVEWDEEQERTWCEYRRDLFTTQHRKNFPRCNKVFMAHGVECRLPFLHTDLVEFALSCPVDVTVVRNVGRGPSKQKAVMYEAWDGLVPDEIVKRHKVAFQDGMGIKQAITDAFGWETNGPDHGGPTDNGAARAFYTRIYQEVYA